MSKTFKELPHIIIMKYILNTFCNNFKTDMVQNVDLKVVIWKTTEILTLIVFTPGRF